MKFLKQFAARIAVASGGNPVLGTITVFLFYLGFNLLEAMLEKLIFGDRFEHWLDPLFIGAFIGYAAYTVWVCAEVSLSNRREDSCKTKS